MKDLLLRMINKDRLKNIQSDGVKVKPPSFEYQTVRLFTILGVLTLIFVLLIRLVQNSSNGNFLRVPASLMDTTESK